MTGLGVVLLAAFQLAADIPPPSEETTRQVRDLAEHLTVEDPKARRQAEEQLLTLGPEAAEVLLEMTKTAEGPQLEAIRHVLPKYGPGAIERLFRGSHRSQFKQQMAEEEAKDAVARMGEAAIPELRRLTTTHHKYSVIGVLKRMGAMGVDELVRLLKHPDKDVRSSAATLLANLADPRSADALLEALRSEDAFLRTESARGLGELRDPRAVGTLLEMLSDANPSPREAAAAALGKMYEPRFLGPVVRIARSDPEPGTRRTAANALIRQTQDPVAVRLGRRYKPISISPARELILNLAVVFRLVVTGLVIYTLVWAGVVKFSQRIGPLGLSRGMWWALLAIVGAGFVWGRLLTGLSGTIELLLLLLCVPAALWFVWTAGPRPKVLLWPASGLGVGCLLTLLASVGGMVWFVVLLQLAPWLVGAILLVSLFAAWRMGRRADPVQRAVFRRAAFRGGAAFYCGYGIGWLALWGYFGI